MFYSETLLSKTGPLARVWLSANLERKLSKNHILQASVKDSVEAIVTPNQAPMALRLSGQLLLGVVRIYSRKAHYLLDDCNEALIKIKMAYRLSGNNDIPAGLHMPSRDALMLPDVLTESDNLEMPPMPDASFLFSQLDGDTNATRKGRSASRDLNMPDELLGSQIYLPEDNRNDEILELLPMDELDLGIDFGFHEEEPSVEMGRDAPAARGVEDDLLSDLGIDLETELPVKDTVEPGDDTTLQIGTGDDNDPMHLNTGGDVEMIDIYDPPDVSEFAAAPVIRPERISESPLSDYDETVIQQGEINLGDQSLFAPEEEVEEPTLHVAPQRARKVKTIEVDQETLISSNVVKEHQRNRERILRPQSFLPRDQQLLALIEMQKNGGFISNILGDGRSMAWAPELRGMLSIDAIRKNGELKRKRDSGVADMDIEDEQGPQKSPRLEIGEEEEDFGVELGDAGLGRKSMSVAPDGTIIEVAGDDGGYMPNLDEDEHNATVGLEPESPAPNFDETTAPLVHPADSGPVSLGTKHAVHLLRERFGAEAADSPDKRKKASVLFQDLLPERQTSRADATKMFFEVLVLATKDAVKVEQSESLLGGPIRVRGKRGLWGDWAETGAGGEIAEEDLAAGPSHGLEQSAAIAVGA
ncbi:Winged helix DNA-binding protein [Glarea lozoyensis ATCC 20868]|uniref:Winged helix DNA-binding protein n=2 Tax=Glarea lozoyensis TaxID=101852 RepID=S3D2S9_GLAL2|nr:Winged helix DNA-binding protein [Glarea lozoyensis ATCC 20868]EHL02838.1 putative Cohesin subunit rad21 [Glarea lozoyensis 74030]EPE26341.1 Winged helix DNA-binding protein [Glarea lozoyensis ATCC 20868]